jgi:formylglycine-generating enzyme required for sulfatase activity
MKPATAGMSFAVMPPRTISGVPKRVTRGGSFLCDASYCASYRPAARMKTSPDTGMIHSGFRAALSDADWRVHLAKQK